MVCTRKARYLYKMLLYEEGAHFKPHKDTEKAPGMFATLAICLPTEHLGGDLDVKHNNKRLTWTSSKTSAFDLSFSAWYVKLTIRLFNSLAQHSSGMPM